MRSFLVAGNWKANGDLQLLASMQSAIAQLEPGLASSHKVEAALYLPHVFLPAALVGESPIRFGAQNIASVEAGAYTGEVTVDMLSQIGVASTLIGHSERRSLYNEADEVLAQKLALAQKQGLQSVFCCGETLAERESGQGIEVVKAQLNAVLAEVNDWQKLVIAYEPVWAIGTGKTASPEQAQEVHKAIRELVASFDASAAARIQILYGGSVNPGNAQELFSQPDIDGGLIGGASLKIDDFVACIKAAQSLV